MEGASPLALVVIMGAAVVAPVLAELTRRFRIPSVLFELILGILIGPFVLGWAEVTPFVAGLSEIGLAFLFFLAGYEIDFAALRGPPLNRAIGGWFASLGLGLLVAGVLVVTGFAISDLLIGLALTTTAIGTLMPILRDRGLLETEWGGYMVAAGALGEFAPILAITLLLSGDSPARSAVLLVAFVAVAVVTAFVATREQPPHVVEVMRKHLHTSTQLPIRIIGLLVTGMVLLAFELGLDTLLGAFTAGLIARLLLSEAQARDLMPRLESLGFGFVIPVFFIVSGMNFDVDALGTATVLTRVPLFLGLFFAVRGLPALVIYRRLLPPIQRWAIAITQATALPLIVVITSIGLETDRMKSENATALLGAAMLSVLVYPLLGFALAERGGVEPHVGADTRDPAPTGT